MGRYKGDKRTIDPRATERFFAERGRRVESLGQIGAVLYQDHMPALAAQRNDAEIAKVRPLLAPFSSGRVLDIGCGTGRWASALSEHVASYLGLDFCQDFLTAAALSTAALPGSSRFEWRHWDANTGTLPTDCAGSFDLIISTGLFLYLNDSVVAPLLQAMVNASAPNVRLYLREPLALEERLTLESHYSEEMNTEYSAVYRSAVEFEASLNFVFKPQGFTLTAAEDLYADPVLNNRADTRQRFYVVTREAA